MKGTNIEVLLNVIKSLIEKNPRKLVEGGQEQRNQNFKGQIENQEGKEVSETVSFTKKVV